MRRPPTALLALLLGSACAETVSPPEAWHPASPHRDTPYLQELGSTLGALGDVRGLALAPDGTLEAASGAGLARFDGSAWVPSPAPLTGTALSVAFDRDGHRGAVFEAGLLIDERAIPLPAGASARFLRPRAEGGFWVGGPGLAAAWDGELRTLWDATGAVVVDIADAPSGWILATTSALVEANGTTTSSAALLGAELRAIARTSRETWVGTTAGLVRRRDGGSEWTPLLGAQGLHTADITALGADGDDLWVATPRGASVYRADGSRRYYLGRLWLPGDEVRAILRLPDGARAFGTAAGVSRVEPRSMTLAERAAIHDANAQRRHVRMGFTSTENHLREPGELSSSYNTDDDNDGQWTAMYLASQCFRFAATGAAEARENARTAARALLRLETVTPRAGFFARSIITREECGDPAARAGEWHASEDGQLCWKGDTSSDELVGHVFGLSLFHDLVADDAEKAEVRATFTRLVDGIVDAGFMIVDVDGEVTTHGNFDPEWMHHSVTAQFGDAGLNSAMILGALLAAHHMSGDPKYLEAYARLARTERYAAYVARIEEINLTVQTNHDSEEMSFLALFTLIRYETDEGLLASYLAGLEGLWQVQRPERNPEFSLMYGALARAEDPDLSSSIETLQKLPLDLVLWGFDHRHRLDVMIAAERDRHGVLQSEVVLPYDERGAMRWAENPYALVRGGAGLGESSGIFWLLPYWMGRYYGFITD